MTRLEFVADRVRRQHFHDRHLAPPIEWAFLQPSERHRWVNLAAAALDADSTWRQPPPEDDADVLRVVA